jgi:hypothetical protein
MESSTKENGKVPIGKGTGFNTGPMELNMKVTGKRTKPAEKASLHMPMAIHMMANGKKTKPMVSVSTLISNLKLDIRVIGKTI